MLVNKSVYKQMQKNYKLECVLLSQQSPDFKHHLYIQIGNKHSHWCEVKFDRKTDKDNNNTNTQHVLPFLQTSSANRAFPKRLGQETSLFLFCPANVEPLRSSTQSTKTQQLQTLHMFYYSKPTHLYLFLRISSHYFSLHF